jgi:hypothetical protein
MAIQDGVNRAAGGNLDFMRQSPHQAFTDLAGAPVRLLALGGHNGGFHLLWQLVGIAMRAPRSIREPLQSTVLIAIQDLVARLPGNPEFSTQGGHALPVLQANHEAYAFVHNRTFLPWHPHFLPP